MELSFILVSFILRMTYDISQHPKPVTQEPALRLVTGISLRASKSKSCGLPKRRCRELLTPSEQAEFHEFHVGDVPPFVVTAVLSHSHNRAAVSRVRVRGLQRMCCHCHCCFFENCTCPYYVVTRAAALYYAPRHSSYLAWLTVTGTVKSSSLQT